MGAEQFATYWKGENATEAFQAAREDAQWEHGHGGYTGTIAEKSGFKIIAEARPSLSKTDARRMVRMLQDMNDPRQDDKWGDAAAIPVAEETGGPVIGWVFFGWASS